MNRFLLAFILAGVAAAQNGPVARDGEDRAIDNALVPTSPTDVITKTVNIKGIVLNNNSSTDTTCYLLDKQGTPREILGSAAAPITVSGSSQIIVAYSFKRRAIGGVTWACAANTVTGYISYEQPR